jgi:hypothetical protein
MKLGELFESGFVINLAERKDRRKAVTRELERAGMPLEPGRVEIFAALRPEEACGFPSPGVRGCFLSHLGALLEARRRNAGNVLVLEDDLAITPRLGEHVEALAAGMAQQSWGFLYLGHVEEVESGGPLQLLPCTRPLVTAHFYAVNGPVMDRLIDFLHKVLRRGPGDPMGGPMHFDGALSMFRAAHPDVLTLIAQPNLGWQRASRSDLHSTWWQRTPPFREAYSIARYLREAIIGQR